MHMIGWDDSTVRARRERGRIGRAALAGVLTLGVGSILGVVAQLPSGAASPSPNAISIRFADLADGRAARRIEPDRPFLTKRGESAWWGSGRRR